MVIQLLEQDMVLPDRMRDHSLAGDLNDVRDCHVRPDLVLLYRKTGPEGLELLRLGSHSELEL